MEASENRIEIFHKDYRRKRQTAPINNADPRFGKLREITADLRNTMNQYPTVLYPEGMYSYHYLLQKFNALAKKTGGQVTGIIDYQNFDVTIKVVCPYFEFFKLDDEWALLKELGERAIYVNFTKAEDDNICLEINFYCFHNLCDDDVIQQAGDIPKKMQKFLDSEEQENNNGQL